MNRGILLFATFVAAAAVLATPAAAQSASGTTDITINLPSFVILYYQGSVTFNPDDAMMASLAGASGPSVDEGDTPTVGPTFSGDAQVDGSGAAIGTATATVTDFWAVRSLAPAGAGGTSVTVSFPAGGDTLTNGAATITLSNLDTLAQGGVDLAGYDGNGITQMPPTGLGAGALRRGDVRFDVDLTAATLSGSYTSGQIQITAANF